MYLDANNLYGWAMSQKLSVNDFKRKNIFKLNENFIKNYDENSNKENVFEVNVEYLKRLHNLDIFKLNENFIKNYDKNSNKENVFEVNVEYLRRLHNLDSDLPFLPERTKLKNATSLYAICMIKTTMLYTYEL